MKSIYFGFILVLVFSCSHYPSDVEKALKLAGDNRFELEKVLEHYSANPKDSLKYLAACFLIGNMPGKYSKDNTCVDPYDLLMEQWEKILATDIKKHQAPFDSLVEQLGLTTTGKIYYDVHWIKASYLVHNIEQSFKVWEEVPWGKDITFDNFCESILPYRVETEPIEKWRDKVIEHYNEIYDSLKNMPEATALDACRYVCAHMNWTWKAYLHPQSIPGMSYSMLERARSGTCEERTAFGTFIMRGLGVPVSIDFTPRWPDRHRGHVWNSLTDPLSRQQVRFMVTDQHPGYNYLSNRKFAKVYRKTWQQMPKEKFYSKDVSLEYFNGADIVLPVKLVSNKSLLGLSVFNFGLWQPVAYCEAIAGEVRFNSVGKEIIYMLLSKDRIPQSSPFKVQNDGSLHFMIPDTSQTVSLMVYRKFPIIMSIMNRMKGGVFKVSDNEMFIPSKDIYKIDKQPDLVYQTVHIERPQKGRFVGYFSPDDSFGEIAELEFYHDNQKIQGTPIGSFPSAIYKAYDGNELTFYGSLASNGTWVGMKFDQPVEVDKIRYLARNDDNNIVSGQIYELFYWNKQWVSLGRQIASEQVLYYNNAPTNALFLLRNLSKGDEERIFTYEFGKQIFW